VSTEDDAGSVLTPAEEIDARAVAWLTELSEGERDEVKFEAWLAESPNNLLAYWRVEAGWDRAGLLSAVRPMRRNRAIVFDRRRWGLWFGRVAAIAFIAGIGTTAVYQLSGDKTETYVTPVGGHRTVNLVDGSRIELNTDTVLRVNVGGQGRKVELAQGEAYFFVKHDQAHPFTVKVGDHRLVDLGTQFVVRKDEDRMKVGLIEGSVQVEDANAWSQKRIAVLAAGDVAVATPGKMVITKGSKREFAEDVAWRECRQVFDHARLADAAAEFNRYNDQKLVIADSRVAQLTFSTAFPTHGVDAFVRVAQKSLGLRIEHKNGEILISR
jgi:transmembrane sensor